MWWKPMLAHEYKPGRHPLAGRWLVSEKLDGVRALWDGERLFTRGGQRIAAPAWFAAALPRGVRLDGELFAGRGNFHAAQAAAARKAPIDSEWRKLRYAVFDVPDPSLTFEQATAALKELLPARGRVAYRVAQRPLGSRAALRAALRDVEARGGEGLMLRRADSRYRAGVRSADLLKVKTAHDAEATVTGYRPGTGRLRGALGALECRWRAPGTGARAEFRVGSGFTDADRAAGYERRFPLGARVTIKFMGVEKSGRPRQPVFMRLR